MEKYCTAQGTSRFPGHNAAPRVIARDEILSHSRIEELGCAALLSWA
jgi:hypothetical protein